MKTKKKVKVQQDYTPMHTEIWNALNYYPNERKKN